MMQKKSLGNIRLVSLAQVAVYTEHWPWLAVIRRIILRMHAWLNYVA
jgi:hypothetical protein